MFNNIFGRLVEFKYLPGDEAVVESSFEVDLHSDLLFLDVQLRVILLALFLHYLNLRVAENKKKIRSLKTGQIQNAKPFHIFSFVLDYRLESTESQNQCIHLSIYISV